MKDTAIDYRMDELAKGVETGSATTIINGIAVTYYGKTGRFEIRTIDGSNVMDRAAAFEAIKAAGN